MIPAAMPAPGAGAARGIVASAAGATSPARAPESAVKTVECPNCHDHRPEGLAACPRCDDRKAARAFLKRVPDGPFSDRLEAARKILTDAILADALEATGGNQAAAARRLDVSQPRVNVLLGEMPHLRAQFPAKPGAPAGSTAARVRDEKGQLRGKAAEAPAPKPKRATRKPASK